MATPVPRILIALLVLLSLTVASWALAHVPLGDAATAVALGIAVLKAAVVLIVFMEIGHAGTPARVIAAITLSFIVLLCAGAAADVGWR